MIFNGQKDDPKSSTSCEGYQKEPVKSNEDPSRARKSTVEHKAKYV